MTSAPHPEEYDLVVLGSGEGGKYLAWTLARKGQSAVVIERKWIGGSCPNIACLPSKNIIHSAKVASYFYRSEEFGISKENVRIDMAAVRERKRWMVTLATDTKIDRVEGKSGEWVKLHGHRGGADVVLEGTHLLVAAGRTPNTGNIGLDLAQVETTERGFVKVDERLQTTAEGVWAIGDCAGSPHFTHVSFDDFRVVRDNILGGNHVTTGRQVPFTMFTDPELARIGLSEGEAKEKGIAYRLAKIPITADLRTRTLSETRGFMKVLVDAQSDQILGFTMFGVMAGEVMATVQVAMLAGLPYPKLRDAVFTHPTMLEGLIPLFSAVPAISRPS
jgi:pyruvate/2-oxoglutarate dehydrogenase complex dihydrolipoamide dehydrogenase (E3) component